jgi:hypothetical protein
MSPLHSSYGKRTTGRPPVADLTEDHLRAIQAEYLATNKTRKSGSIELAWVRFCETTPGFGHLVADHIPLTTIPTAAVDACRRVKALVGPTRGGAPRLRHEAAYVPGTMRLHPTEKRRLYAGEQVSIDDATRNIACYIPWPWGGCRCSDKFGVRVGRWQTLIVHDDASSYIPSVTSVFRWASSYRGTDAALAIYHAERDVCQFDHWVIEGGVWQSRRVLDILGGRFYSAKGRPNQKLVENFIGRLWDIMAGQPGDVGRHRGEMKAASELYCKCRDGRIDPRLHFLPLDTAQEALYRSIQYLNERQLRSQQYGSWVPQARWEADMAARLRPQRTGADAFLCLPVAETRKVHRGGLNITETGPYGVPMKWTFQSEWLWQYEGREVTAYFDPSAEWPVEATITLPGSRKPLGLARCENPLDLSRDRAIEMAKAIRQTMMTETRILSTLRTERIVRHPGGNLHQVADPAAAPAAVPVTRETAPDFRQPLPDRAAAALPRPSRDPLAAVPRVSREDLAGSLARRAARLRGDTLPVHQ